VTDDRHWPSLEPKRLSANEHTIPVRRPIGGAPLVESLVVLLSWIARDSRALPPTATVFLVLVLIAPRYFRGGGADWASWLRGAIGLSLVVLLGILAARMLAG